MGTPRAVIIETARSTLDTKVKNNASTYADTALTSYSRLYTAAGITSFRYRGPRDLKTRPFCEKHINLTYTLEEIKSWTMACARR